MLQRPLEPSVIGPEPLAIDALFRVAVGGAGQPLPVNAVRELSPALADDRCLDRDLERVAAAVAEGGLGHDSGSLSS